uniref:Putative cytochrome P450 n=1 Tax=Moniliophthora roreri TaxID=221103 RepID=A0A0W0EXE6_MONRR
MDLTLFVACAFCASLLFWLTSKPRGRTPLPPGPPADPFIGHLRMMPKEKTAETFHEWTQKYGDVMYLNIFGRKMIVLGSFETAQELLDQKGSNYSCRPKFVVYELMGWVPSLSFLQYGKQFLKHRKMVQQFFGRKESLGFVGIIAEESHSLLKHLARSAPGEHFHDLHRYTTSNILRVTFGHRVKSDDDIFLQLVGNLAHIMSNSGPPGNTPVDLFPWLAHLPKWFPGTYYASMARSGFESIRKSHDFPVEVAQERMKAGNLERCFLSEHLGALGDKDDPEHLEDIKGAGATILGAGDGSYISKYCWANKLTCSSQRYAFLLAMVLYPDCQNRGYEEILSVVGKDRLPEYNDRDSLPYLDCIIQETLRWHPVAPIGPPHRSLQDDVYNGMFIPGDTVILPNIRGMGLDERVYSNPRIFDPTRYLPSPLGKNEPRFDAAWGFGRRVCPGRHFADLAVWHAMAGILAILEICPVKDSQGNVVLPKEEFTEGLVSQAMPFKCELKPRSEAARHLLEQIEI